MWGTGDARGRKTASSTRMLLVLALLSTLASTMAASVRMSKAAERRHNKSKLSNRRSGIVNNQRTLGGKKLGKKHTDHDKHSKKKTDICRSYSCSQLESYWNWPGAIPNCPGKNCDFSGSGGGGGSGSGGAGSGDDDSSGGGGGGGSGDDDSSGGSGVGDGDGDDDGSGGGGDDGIDNQQEDPYDDTVDDDYDDYTDFDIQNCTSYSEYWLWDLALTCDEDASNSTNCECTSAAILLQNGNLQCPNGTDAAPYCPDDCDLCDTCLTLLGCAETKPPSRWTSRKLALKYLLSIF